MRELGGYIEFEHYKGMVMHSDGLALNCGRNCLAYLIEAHCIKRIALPYFNCDTVAAVCRRYNLTIRYYHIGYDFLPNDLEVSEGEWLYVVNYYGQLSRGTLCELYSRYPRLILDNAQAYFTKPLPRMNTLYTCRKFFGVADGAFLFTDMQIERCLPLDESFKRMQFLLGRFERSAQEFYEEFVANNELFDDEPIKRMSNLTYNLLRGIDYVNISHQREQNFTYLHRYFREMNELHLYCPSGPFMYPLLVREGRTIRKLLQARKIYIPMLWPDVLEICQPQDKEYDMADNILPLPCDQRYGLEDMIYLAESIDECMNGVRNG